MELTKLPTKVNTIQNKRVLLQAYRKNPVNVVDAHTMYYIIIVSGRYRSWRAKVLMRDGNKCRECGSEERLSVHHIITLRRLIENFKNMETS
jgi:hypothetical protein